MRAAATVLLVLIAAACAKERPSKPLSEPGEKVYELKGKIVARDASDNILTINHEPIPGFMEAMTMEYSVRGAEVSGLPPTGTHVKAKLHVTERAYWITDVTQTR